MTRFRLNGAAIEVSDTSPETPLLWVLREHLKLTGTKFGCGRGLCGACTVHVNGAAVRSCQVPLGALSEQDVTTIEGLGARGELNNSIAHLTGRHMTSLPMTPETVKRTLHA